MGRRSAILALLLTVALGMSCAPSGTRAPGASATSVSPTSEGAKRIVLAMMGEPAGFIARMNTTQSSIPGVSDLEQLVNASLSEQIADGSLQPVLADAVPSIDNGLWQLLPDGRMVTTWRIRAGALWHDAVPFTADDLVFTTTVDQNKDVPIFRPDGYASVQQVDALDPQTIRVIWSQPYIFADSMFTEAFASPLPEHILEDSYDSDLTSFFSSPYWTQQFVGTGPYMVQEWVPGSYIRLAANDAYVLGRPKIDDMEIRFITDLNAVMTNLIAGSMDATLGRGITVEAALQLRDQWPAGKMDEAPASWIVGMPQFVNPTPAVLQNPDFRRALLYGVDRQQLVDSLQGGLVTVADQLISPSYREHDAVEDAAVQYSYDPTRAAQLIESLGYSKGADGVYRDATGAPLALEIRDNTEPITEQAIIPIAAAWTQLGIDVQPNLVPLERLSDRQYLAEFPGVRIMRQPDDPDALSRFLSDQTPLPENKFVGRNYSRYRDPALDSLITQYYATVPWDDRMGALRQLVQYMTSNVTMLGMFYDADITYMNARVVNMDSRESTVWNVQLWDVSS